MVIGVELAVLVGKRSGEKVRGKAVWEAMESGERKWGKVERWGCVVWRRSKRREYCGGLIIGGCGVFVSIGGELSAVVWFGWRMSFY